MPKPTVNIHWFRRDLRLNDNTALQAAHLHGEVIGLFIFDSNILEELDVRDDARVTFIHDALTKLEKDIHLAGGRLLVRHGDPLEVWKQLTAEFDIEVVFTNEDYEPYAIKRDATVSDFLHSKNITFSALKDHVILAKNEVQKEDGTPYTVYTPYARKWKSKLQEVHLKDHNYAPHWHPFKVQESELLTLKELGFVRSALHLPEPIIPEQIIRNYHLTRDFPAVNGVSRIGVHLRFGTVSIREVFRQARQWNEKYINELIWREFYQMILLHFPHVVTRSFKPAYDNIQWQNNEDLFQAWCAGKTGFPIVDAGMRELNATGFMHNRVRMITASFLTKDLHIDWRKGEAYFASKLLDYELASNNGGWQWAAGSGCDAAPYFRIFNPESQTKKFDPKNEYIRKWIPEFDTPDYPTPIVNHSSARLKTLRIYKEALASK